MEFQKERVFTALNAEKVKLGSVCIFADTLKELKTRVINDSLKYTLAAILDESSSSRFVSKSGTSWELCYLVSEPEKKKLKWTDLKVGDVVKKANLTLMVTGIEETGLMNSHISLNGTPYGDEILADWEKVENA